jgi:hypothetical protein
MNDIFYCGNLEAGRIKLKYMSKNRARGSARDLFGSRSELFVGSYEHGNQP